MLVSLEPAARVAEKGQPRSVLLPLGQLVEVEVAGAAELGEAEA